MNNTIMDNLQRAREEFEAALDDFLAALDKEHYPDSLRESITAVLKAPGAPRGLPLFLQNLAQSRGGNFPPAHTAGPDGRKFHFGCEISS